MDLGEVGLTIFSPCLWQINIHHVIVVIIVIFVILVVVVVIFNVYPGQPLQ